MLFDRAKDAVAPIVALAPDSITIHASLQAREVFLRFRGLVFGRWQDDRIFFDVHGMWQELGARSMVARDLSRVDLNLHPDLLYKQVFAQSARQRGILDLLTVTRFGRLAIIELKASEKVDLPLQAADYWSRIRQHQQAGDFAHYGYFTGITLQSAPPIVYIISPALHFHPSTDALLRYLSPEIEIIRIGVAESWRRGIRVVMRQ